MFDMIKYFKGDFMGKKRKQNESLYVLKRLKDLNPNVGLTNSEAYQRFIHHYNNENKIKTTKSAWQILRGNIFTFFNMLYMTIMVLLIIAGVKENLRNLNFIPVVVANTLLGLIQEFRAKRIIEKLNLVTNAAVTVIRDGEKKEVKANEVVIDDIVSFKSGNQIIADSIVKTGFVEVNESLLTGEPDAVLKEKGDKLMSGSFVVSGSCLAQVEHVGKDNYVEKLAIAAKKQKANKSELLKTLNWIIKIIGIVIVPMAILLFYKQYDSQGGSLFYQFQKIFPNVAGAIIGMIPSGLFLLTTTALAAGVYRLAAKNKTMVQQLYCIEMLARIDILCLDKTGTITDGTMRVIDCIELKNDTDYSLRDIVGSMMGAFDDTNATSEALIRFFDVNHVLTPVKTIPFSSQRKFSAVAFKGAGTFFLGAPEFVCPEGIASLKARVDKYASMGCRVLLLTHVKTIAKSVSVPKSVRPVGMIVIQDHIRDDVASTIDYFQTNGVEVKVISGDNPVTVVDIAKRAGIKNTAKYISLDGMSEEEVKDVAFDYTIFGRVSPAQKKTLVEAYKEKKKTVAMTGDGVNDILALKEADCSIAMASGSEATRNVANIVLLDSNFNAMPSVVREGRRVINNIQRTSTLFLTKTLFTIFLTLFSIVMSIEYFFESSQLILIEILITGFAATLIALIPNNEKVKGRFIANVILKTLPGALVITLFNILIFLIGRSAPEFGWFMEGERTSLFTTVTVLVTTATCLFVLYKMCKPFDKPRFVIFVFVVAAMIVFMGSGMFYPATKLGSLVNGMLLLDWPLTGEFTYLNTMTVLVFILLISPLFNLFAGIISWFRKIKMNQLDI